MRDLRIQALRGVAVALVVLLHALKMIDGTRGAVADIFPNDNFGAVGVDLFFVISGAVMAGAMERAESPTAFLRDRARRLLPMWWLATTAFLMLGLFLSIPSPPEGLLNTLTLVPLFDRGTYDLPIPGVGWTLGYEAVFYLIVAAALAWPGRGRAALPPAILALLGAAGLVLRPADPLGGHVCNAILFEFLLGMLAFRAARKGWAAPIAPALVTIATVALVVPMLLGHRFPTDQWAVVEGRTGLLRSIIWGLPCAMLLLGLTARSDRRRRETVPLVRLGDASYSIYLTHTFFTVASIYLWPWRSVAGSDLLFVALLASGFGSGFAVHHLIERPLLARLRRQTSDAASASTVRPRSLTSAKPPSTWMRAERLFAPE